MAGYTMKVTKDIYVTMRDGTRIALAIYQPDAPGKFPALFAMSPYQYEFDEVPAFPLFLWKETGPVEWYVSQGYAYVHMDVRGSGRSEGEFCFLGKPEIEDGYEVVEWIAKQEWCTGKVGGVGQSYYAMAQWLLAALNPPHLACIVPYDGLIDQYRDNVYHGGIFCDYRSNWFTNLRSNTLHRQAGSNTGRPIKYDLVADLIGHQTYDDFWRERSAQERIKQVKVPTLSIGHWGKQALHLRGNLLGYELLECPKKLIVTGAKDVYEAHHMFDEVEFHEKHMLPFYDHFLKGVQNGVMDGPPVEIFVKNAETWRGEKEWPLSRAEYVAWHLRSGPSGSVTSLNDGKLTRDAPPKDDKPTTYSYPDAQWKVGTAAMTKDGPDPVRRILTFTSDPLEVDIEVTGPILLELHASSDQRDTQFICKLSEVNPQPAEERAAGKQPRYTIVSRGWLKASHRELDEKESKPFRPFYTHRRAEPLEPGKVYTFQIEVLATSYVFRKGHRIRLELANGDSRVTDAVFSHPYHPTSIGSDTIWHDAAHPSRLMLPVIK